MVVLVVFGMMMMVMMMVGVHVGDAHVVARSCGRRLHLHVQEPKSPVRCLEIQRWPERPNFRLTHSRTKKLEKCYM